MVEILSINVDNGTFQKRSIVKPNNVGDGVSPRPNIDTQHCILASWF